MAAMVRGEASAGSRRRSRFLAKAPAGGAAAASPSPGAAAAAAGDAIAGPGAKMEGPNAAGCPATSLGSDATNALAKARANATVDVKKTFERYR